MSGAIFSGRTVKNAIESKQSRGRTLTAVKANRATRLRSAAAQRIIKQPVRRTTSNEALPTASNIDKHTTVEQQHLQMQYMRNLQQQVQLLELENAYFKKQRATPENAEEDEDILVKAERLLERTQNAVDDHTSNQQSLTPNTTTAASKLAALNRPASVSLDARPVVRGQLDAMRDTHTRVKHEWYSQIATLREELDKLRPQLAKKQTELTECLAHRAVMETKLHELEQECMRLKQELQNRDDQYATSTALQSAARHDAEMFPSQLHLIEQQLIECRRELQSERSTVANLRRTQAHAELIAQKEKSLGQKLLEENERLMNENAKLTSEVQAYKDSEGRWDKPLEDFITPTQLAALRNSERQAKAEIEQLKNVISQREASIAQLKQQMNTAQQSYTNTASALHTVKMELEQLESANKKLSEECSTLRNERNALVVRLDNLSATIGKKERELASFRERLILLEQHHSRLLQMWHADADEKCQEYSSLAARVDSMSQSLHAHALHARRTTDGIQVTYQNSAALAQSAPQFTGAYHAQSEFTLNNA